MRGAARYNPGVQRGSIFPEHLAGMLGLPSIGDIWYVDANSGSDTNSGTARKSAFATVAAALSAATADQDDVVLLVGSNSTGRTTETAAIDWNKRRTHLVGNGPLRKINPRQGLAFNALGGDVCFTVSATDCHFMNVTFASFTDNNVLVDVTAAYNTFDYCHFQGIGNATTGDDTAARSLRISGSDEVIVRNSTIGLDTVTRSAANASLELTGTCARCEILNCDFPMFADNAGALWIKADTGNCYERYLKLENCNFFNPDGSSSTTLTVGFDLSTTGNGDIYMRDCNWRGATDLANNYTRLFSNHPVVDTGDQGLMIVQAT